MASCKVDMLERSLKQKMETITGFGSKNEQIKRLETVFKKFDQDGSGELDYTEFEWALAQLNFVDVSSRGLFDRYDADGTGRLNYKEFCNGLYGTTGAASINPNATSAIGRLRARIAQRGGMNGMRTLSRLFRIIDDSGNKKLSRDELMWGLADFGLQMTQQDINTIWNTFDRNRDGTISFDEFLRGIRGPLNGRRKRLIDMAYDVLDRSGDGQVTLQDLVQIYDVSQNPEVVNGDKSPEQALREFMRQWDTDKPDGTITREEFLEYYRDVSASIDDDDYFELVIRNAWHIMGGEGAFANTSNLRVLLTYTDGSERVVAVNNDMGLDRDDIEGIARRLEQQGEDMSAVKGITTAL